MNAPHSKGLLQARINGRILQRSKRAIASSDVSDLDGSVRRQEWPYPAILPAEIQARIIEDVSIDGRSKPEIHCAAITENQIVVRNMSRGTEPTVIDTAAVQPDRNDALPIPVVHRNGAHWPQRDMRVGRVEKPYRLTCQANERNYSCNRQQLNDR